MKYANATLILVSYNLYGKTLNRTFTELKNLVSLTSVLLCDIWNGLKLKFWQTYKDKNTNKRKFTSREIISHKTTVCFCTVFSLFLRPHRIFVISKTFCHRLKRSSRSSGHLLMVLMHDFSNSMHTRQVNRWNQTSIRKQSQVFINVLCYNYRLIDINYLLGR